MSINLGDKLEINLIIDLFDAISELFVSIDIINSNSELVAHITNEDDGISFKKLENNNKINLNIKTESLLFIPGLYRMNLWLGSEKIETLYTISNFLIFQIEQGGFTKRTKSLPKHSKFYLPTHWETIN